MEKLKKELHHLKQYKRKEIAERLARSAAFGDLSENSEYIEAKEAQAFLEGRILELEELIRNAVVVDPEIKKDQVQIGSWVLLKSSGKKEKFKIVGAEEANPLEGKISIDSPLGKALLGKAKGQEVEVESPEGKISYKILKIE